MQRVVRSTLVGLSLIGLAACGDKVNILQDTTPTQTTESVTSVSVTPANLQLAVGGTASVVATVTATPGITNRTVTWSSSNTAVATVTAAGVVTAVSAGTAAIVATSVADTKVTGAAAITVTTAQLVTVSIATINTTIPGTGSVPAVLANFGTGSPAGTSQLDVTLNVEGAISGAAVIVTCGTKADTVSQGTFPTVAPVDASASESAVPITLSINTARLDANLVPRLLNGQCTIRGAVKTATGTQAITSNTALTLNNADVSIVTVTATAQATDPNSKVWFGGGPVTIAATPIFYSGRTATAVTLGLAANPAPVSAAVTNSFTAGSAALPAPLAATASGATWSATYTIAQPAGAGSLFGVGASNLVPTVTVVDNQGNTLTAMQPFTVGTSATNRFTPTTGTFALDEQKPAPGTFPIANNTLQQTGPNGYVSGNFRFVGDSAAGYTGATPGAAPLVFVDRTVACSPAGVICNQDNGGVDKVAVSFQWRVTGAGASTYAALTNTSALNETATATGNQFRMLTADAVGNTDTTTFAGALSNFGVDKTAPTVTVTGPAANAQSKVIGGNGTYALTVSDGLSGSTATNLVAQTRLSAAFLSSTATPAENVTNVVAGPCVIGRFNATAAASGAGALTVFDASGNARGFCTPVLFNTNAVAANGSALIGYYTTTLIGIDEAGNRATAVTNTVVDDPTATDTPVVSSIDMPPTVTGNSTASFPASATDGLDLVSSFATITYAGAAVALQYPGVSGPGVPFDNVLTRSATITPTVPNFIKNLQVAQTPAPVVAPVAGGNATTVTVGASDEVFNNAALTVAFAPGVTLANGASSTFSTATFTGGMGVFSGSTVSNGPTVGATAPTTLTFTATAQGTSGLFANPFVGGQVQIWYQPNGAGNWFFAGNAGAGLSRDNGTNRFWDYTLTWDPPATAPDGTSLTTNGMAINVRAIGVNTNGDAVSSGVNTVTVANP